MKRSELRPGLVVEVQEGRTWATFRRAIVLDTRPWTDGRYTQWSPFRPHRVKRGQGVAVALESTDFLGTGKPSVWLPDVIQLTKLKLTGTQAALQAKQAAELERRERADAERSEREAQLRKRAEVQNDHALRFRYSRYSNGPGYFDTHTVELTTSELERLLDERDELRRQLWILESNRVDDAFTEHQGDPITGTITALMRQFRAGVRTAREELLKGETHGPVSTESQSFQDGYHWVVDEARGPSFKGGDDE